MIALAVARPGPASPRYADVALPAAAPRRTSSPAPATGPRLPAEARWSHPASIDRRAPRLPRLCCPPAPWPPLLALAPRAVRDLRALRCRLVFAGRRARLEAELAQLDRAAPSLPASPLVLAGLGSNE